MLLLGIDVGTSSIKVSVVDAMNGKCLSSAQHPVGEERSILSAHPGWAEQSPNDWWTDVQAAILQAHASGNYNSQDIAAIGIAYQMHGLVLVDKRNQLLRNSIIWCDSRAVAIGDRALHEIGEEYCLTHLLNSPGNFTASKLAWVRENEPGLYSKIGKAMLPGDYIALRFTNNITTTSSALSEGIFWDFRNDGLSEDVMRHFQFDLSILPPSAPLFSNHGFVSADVAKHLALKPGIPVAYKAGDQPNNALSLNVLEPGEVAATAGTSGVIYAVTNKPTYDRQSRVNTFVHVNHTADAARYGVLLCINGTGILNRWVRDHFAKGTSYDLLNKKASGVPLGSEGLTILPFGNGAERMLNNLSPGAQFKNIDFTRHGEAQVFRAAQEGIACAFRYGLDILRENNIHPTVIRVGKANLFLSELFTELFVNLTQVPVELYEADGSIGAAIGAGIGAGIYKSPKEAFSNFKPFKSIAPLKDQRYNELYQNWKDSLTDELKQYAS